MTWANYIASPLGCLGVSVVKNPPVSAGDVDRSLGWEVLKK